MCWAYKLKIGRLHKEKRGFMKIYDEAINLVNRLTRIEQLQLRQYIDILLMEQLV